MLTSLSYPHLQPLLNVVRDFKSLHVKALFFFIFLISTQLNAQEKLVKEEKKEMMKDTLDGKFDFSRYLVDAHGFIPVPVIITEPALGGFGGLVAPVFIQPKKLEGYSDYIPPDITAGMGMYTMNGSWMVGAGRMGSFPKAGIKYRAFVGYGSFNLDYYRDIPLVGEKSFTFNIEALATSLSISKRIAKENQVYVGLEYRFAPTKVKSKFMGELPFFVNDKDLDNQTAPLGIFMDRDSRNSVFTADKGTRLHVQYNINDQWTGSDFAYQRIDASFNWFIPVKDTWVCGWRAEIQHMVDDPPFYLLPSISLRGVPAARYQGSTTALIETEQRFDLNLRWSIVGFAGLGKAIERDQSFGDGKTVYNVGTGFRYLLARVFKLRGGIDIAKGPDSFGYYIVFGHNWNR